MVSRSTDSAAVAAESVPPRDAATLLSDLNGGVLTLTLNRPAKRNALDWETLRALDGAAEQAGDDPGVR